LTPLLFDAGGASGGLQGSSCGDDLAEDGKPMHFVDTGSYSASPTRQPMGEGEGALPGAVAHIVVAVITEKNDIGEMTIGEAFGAVGVWSYYLDTEGKA